MHTTLLVLLAAAAPAREPLLWEVDGYWKARGAYIRNLFLGQGDTSDVGLASGAEADGRLGGLDRTGYLEHHMRLSPTASFKKLAKLQLDVDVLEGVMWGDNDARASLPLFAGSPTDTGRDGEPVDSLHVRRAWLELAVPLGLLRVGRQPSHWGMGLLANKGDGLDADFGDFRYGTTADRILFATRPLEVARTLAGSDHPKSNLTLALAYDKLVDDAIDSHDPEADLERNCRECPPQILLSRPNDDVDQFVGVLLYKDDRVSLWSERDQLAIGTYIVHRVQRDTDSKIWVVDGYARARIGVLGLESELIWISGESSAVSGANPKQIDIKGGVVRAGAYDTLLDVELELGRAPGDDEPTDATFTGYPLHPDYNVGLLLYEEVLAARTARAWTKEQRGLWSNGGVWNSTYVAPKVRWRPTDGLTIIGMLLWARAQRDTNAVWNPASEPEGRDLDLGTEVDLAVRYDFFEHAHVKLEGGVLFPGRALWKDVAPEVHDLQITDADAADAAWTVSARLGFAL